MYKAPRRSTVYSEIFTMQKVQLIMYVIGKNFHSEVLYFLYGTLVTGEIKIDEILCRTSFEACFVYAF